MVSKRLLSLLTLTALSISSPFALGDEQQQARSSRFPVASIRFEQNATDGDVEVVIEAVGRSDGLTKLSITAPNGAPIIDFNSPRASSAQSAQKASGTGIRQFTFESPEPIDVESLKRAYPAGEYTFEGTTASGQQLRSKATLKQALPKTTSFITPKADAKDVPVKNVKLEWARVEGVTDYAIELTHEDSAMRIEARLPASATTFSVPDGFLLPGSTYRLGIGTVSTSGNVSYFVADFSTAADK